MASLKLVNTSLAADIDGSEKSISYLTDTQHAQVIIIVKVTTTAANQTIALYGKADTAGAIDVVALHTNMTYQRLA